MTPVGKFDETSLKDTEVINLLDIETIPVCAPPDVPGTGVAPETTEAADTSSPLSSCFSNLVIKKSENKYIALRSLQNTRVFEAMINKSRSPKKTQIEF